MIAYRPTTELVILIETAQRGVLDFERKRVSEVHHAARGPQARAGRK